MLWKESEAVPEGKCPVPQQEEFGSGEPTLADVYRLFEEIFDRQQERMDSFFDGMDSCFDRWNKKLDEISDEMRKMDEHVTRLEHGARQPRLAMEADGQANTKTRERTEGAATAGQAIRGNGFSARLVEPSPNTNSTSFGVKAEPPALPCRDDVVVKSGAAASESCLPSVEMRSSTAAGGLVPTGEASTAKEISFIQPPLRFCSTEETDLEAKKSWTSAPSASYYSSSVFQERNLSATPYCRRVVDTKSRLNRTFNPGGLQARPSFSSHPKSRPASCSIDRNSCPFRRKRCPFFSAVYRILPQKVDIHPPAWVHQTRILLARGRGNCPQGQPRSPSVVCQGNLSAEETSNASVLMQPSPEGRS